jgi:hypothetical protein
MIEDIVNSFQRYLYNSDIPCYIYTNTSENIDASFTCRSKTPLLSTDKTFTLQVKVGSNFYDALNSNPYYLINKYVKFLNTNSIITHIKIVGYDNTTGVVTLASDFGKAMATTDTFELVVLDSIFVTDLNQRDLGNQFCLQKRFVRFDMTIKTKEDSNKTKARKIIESLQNIFGSYRSCPIYNMSAVEISQLNFNDSGSYNPIYEKEEQIIAYLGSVACNYYVSR